MRLLWIQIRVAPDDWETANKPNPKNDGDRKTYSLISDYTHLEIYLNDLVSSKIEFGNIYH